MSTTSRMNECANHMVDKFLELIKWIKYSHMQQQAVDQKKIFHLFVYLEGKGDTKFYKIKKYMEVINPQINARK